MKSLKELLFTGMFVVMTAAMFVACGGGEGTETPDAPKDAPEVMEDAAKKMEEGSAAVKEAAGEIKEEAEAVVEEAEEEWFPEDVVPSGSAANN